MGIFDKFKKKNKMPDSILVPKTNEEIPREINSIQDLNNYMLSDINKEEVEQKATKISIDKLREISPIAIPVVDTIKHIIEENNNPSNKLFCVTNLEKNDSLKSLKGGMTFSPYVNKADGTSKMGILKEINPSNALQLDPATMMIALALSGIEKELGEIKEISKKILSFLEVSRESQIKADVEILNSIIENLRFNLANEKYINSKLIQVNEIIRKANENLKTYKSEIKEELLKNKLFTTNNSMENILEIIEKKFKYYRMSLYNYALSLYLEVYLEGNYNKDYLLSRKKELEKLNNDYLEDYNHALEYLKKNANKSLTGNVLLGLGSAGKTIGNLAEKANVKSFDNWLNEKSDYLLESGKSIKENFVLQFSEIKDTKIQIYIYQLENLNNIIYKTRDIYFDSHYVYFIQDDKEESIQSIK